MCYLHNYVKCESDTYVYVCKYFRTAFEYVAG